MQVLTLLALSLVGATATAFDTPVTSVVRLEAAAALPLTQPQAGMFYPGFAALLHGGASVGWVDGHLGAFLLVLPGRPRPSPHLNSLSGGIGGGLRVKVPEARWAMAPWVDADVYYARTATLNRLAYSVGIGAQARLSSDPTWRLGPVVRFLQVTNPSTYGFDDRDAFLLSVGVMVELGDWRPRFSKSCEPAGGSSGSMPPLVPASAPIPGSAQAGEAAPEPPAVGEPEADALGASGPDAEGGWHDNPDEVGGPSGAPALSPPSVPEAERDAP